MQNLIFPYEKQHVHKGHKNQAHNSNSWTYRPTYASYQLPMEYTLHVIIRLHAIYDVDDAIYEDSKQITIYITQNA
jgi:hypothetical protein